MAQLNSSLRRRPGVKSGSQLAEDSPGPEDGCLPLLPGALEGKGHLFATSRNCRSARPAPRMVAYRCSRGRWRGTLFCLPHLAIAEASARPRGWLPTVGLGGVGGEAFFVCHIERLPKRPPTLLLRGVHLFVFQPSPGVPYSIRQSNGEPLF